MSDISNKNSLLELYMQRKTGKVTDKWHSYLIEYEKILRDYRQMPISLLEIGIQNGGSLEIWGNYFENAQLIVGCEIHESARSLKYDNKIIKVVIGDANSEATLKNILDLSSSYDLIIDDGSHTSKDIIQSFAKYFPYLKQGGKYIIEDLHASYWGKWGGGLAFPLSSISFLKRLIDAIHKEHWGVSKDYSWLFKFFELNYETQFDNFPFSQIHSIEFVNSICIITKQEEEENQLGLRVVSGDIEQVSAGIKRLNSTYSPTANQDQNQWSNLKFPIEEELIACKRRVAELEKQLYEINHSRPQQN